MTGRCGVESAYFLSLAAVAVWGARRVRFGCVCWAIVLNEQCGFMVGGIRGVGLVGIECGSFEWLDLQGSAHLVRVQWLVWL